MLRLERGGLQRGEGQTIFDELAESFVLLSKLQRADGIAIVGSVLGQILAAADDPDQALAVLDQSAAAFEQLRQADRAAQVRELRRSIEEGKR